MNGDEYYCLRGICENGDEEEAIRFLFNSLNAKYKEALHKKTEYSATIRTVKAINRGRNKDIDNLCDVDDEHKEDTEQEINGTCKICLYSKFNSSGMLKCTLLDAIVVGDDTCDKWKCAF